MIELNPKFKPILTTDKRIIIITGGRGSAKSFSTSTIGTLITYEKGNRVLYTRFTMVSAKISIIPEFEEKIALLEVPQQFEIQQTQIVNKLTGSDIIFKGIKTGSSNQTAALKSIKGVSVWVLDEAEELTDQDVFDKINLSIRQKGVRNLIILILNPTTISHWIWEEYFENSHTYIEIDGCKVPISTDPRVEHIHTTYLDNLDHLDHSFLSEIEHLKKNNPAKYSHKIIGGWLEQAEGAIYKNWKEGEFDTSLPYCYGLDFGYFPDPLALVKVAVDKKKKKIYLKEEVYKTELSNEQLIKILKNRVGKIRDLIVCDTSEPRLIQEINKKTKFKAIKAIKGPDSIINGIKAIQDFEIIVTPESYNLKKELRLYEWNDKKASIPIDDYNHGLDALRYAFGKLNRSKKGGIKSGNRRP